MKKKKKDRIAFFAILAEHTKSTEELKTIFKKSYINISNCLYIYCEKCRTLWGIFNTIAKYSIFCLCMVDNHFTSFTDSGIVLHFKGENIFLTVFISSPVLQ